MPQAHRGLPIRVTNKVTEQAALARNQALLLLCLPVTYVVRGDSVARTLRS
jgi:hypothetical protein